MKKKEWEYMIFFAFFFAVTLYVSEKPQTDHRCNFVLLPVEIQNHIASYVQFANMVYESDDFFAERAKKLKSMSQKEKISDNKSLKINDHGDLVKITKLFKVIRTNDYIFESSSISPIIFSKNPNVGSLTIQEKASFFTFSPSGNYLALLTEKESSNEKFVGGRINIYTCSNDVILINNSLSLDDFYFKGCIAFSKENKPRGYKYFSQRFHQNPIRLIAISNTGQLAFANDHEVFVIDGKNIKKIHEDHLKYIGPFPTFTTNDTFFKWPGNMVDLCFNKQGTKLVYVHHFLYDCFFDKEENQIAANEIKYNRELFVKCIEYFLNKHYPSLNYDPILLNNLARFSPCEFLEDLAIHVRIDDDELVDGLFKEKGSGSYIQLQQEEPWTLARYFKLKGVCKNLNQQCGLANDTKS